MLAPNPHWNRRPITLMIRGTARPRGTNDDFATQLARETGVDVDAPLSQNALERFVTRHPPAVPATNGSRPPTVEEILHAQNIATRDPLTHRLTLGATPRLRRETWQHAQALLDAHGWIDPHQIATRLFTTPEPGDHSRIRLWLLEGGFTLTTPLGTTIALTRNRLAITGPLAPSTRPTTHQTATAPTVEQQLGGRNIRVRDPDGQLATQAVPHLRQEAQQRANQQITSQGWVDLDQIIEELFTTRTGEEHELVAQWLAQGGITPTSRIEAQIARAISEAPNYVVQPSGRSRNHPRFDTTRLGRRVLGDHTTTVIPPTVT